MTDAFYPLDHTGPLLHIVLEMYVWVGKIMKD